ncbi:Cytochrome P450 monooxygenase BOA7 [Colletotrichum orbiculare MAFF 240422]|uniref:Cytochrome P450 monooxygenase BOA7 n=1 Tax=Colletotrichum orbiculare (strain 104-T / ATCC 96160 / CBS 514.97 / LARS 414 / MAFF 240422) TaxID=1213857 RepID=A0A484FW04_COLOR|nr:Cytochrome P450 monooxygenase BOA7 [Colletotrichum orbiculare MAFF 240422]
MIDATSFLIFTAFLRRQTTNLGGLLFFIAVIATVLLAKLEIRPRRKLSLPVVGEKTDRDYRAALTAGRRLYPDQAFALPSEPPIVILPHGMINRLKSAPETQLSADKEVCRRGLGQYTDLGTPMPEMFHAIQIDLTRHVRDLVPTLQNQVAYAFERHLRLADDQDWKEVTAFELVKRVVTILNATAFVGTELARNEEWQEIAYNYSSDLRRAFDALNSWHPWLRPFVHPFIFRHIGFSARRQRVAEMLRPLIRKNETSSPRADTLLNYITGRLPPKDRDDSRLMARMQLRAALAGSDTVAQALTNAIFDIASDAGCAEQLRGEVSDLASATRNGRWDMTMLRSMSKLDSLLRESARLWAPFLLAMGRITTSPLRLDDGTVVPKDTTVYFDMYNAHRTPDKSHIEDMTSFNGLRFSEWRERDKLPNKYLAATTGADNLPFGHGAHSCPGRFFAVAEMKVVLCHLLLEYEFKLPSGKRPPTGYWGVATVMDRQAKMMIRRRRRNSDAMGFNIEVMTAEPGKKTKFGATITGLDINNISDEDLLSLRRAVWRHKLVIIKGQHDLKPIKHWELVTRLDPDAGPQNPELFMKDFHPRGGGILASRGVTGVPGAENVHVIGKGFQGDHFGLKDLNLNKSFSYENHLPTLPPEELENGHTRFQGWHFDAPLYSRDPPWFTAFRVLRLPRGPDVDIQWDDGSGYSMKSAPGLTMFFCCSQLYEELLSDEEKEMADNSWVEYAALPYEWNRNCKFKSTGLGIVSQGRELSDEELLRMGSEKEKIKRYPMVWINPETGRKSFQVQANAAKKLFIRRSADEKPQVVDDVAEVRRILLEMQSRILRPEYIMAPPEEEGDLLLWDNCATMHTRVDYPAHYGIKTCHQAATNASQGPIAPSPMPAV